MSTPHGANLVARLTTTFSRQRCRIAAPHTAAHRFRSTARPTETPNQVDTSFYEDGFIVPEPSVSFLEPDGEEYHRVVLPPRQRRLYTPPWPTILPHHTVDPLTRLPVIEHQRHPHAPVTYLKRSTFSQDNPTPCQALHHLIRVEKDYPAARQLLAEFKDLGIPIRPHRAYLDAAVHQARRRGKQAEIKKDVLDWLGYWYAFHPVKQFRHGPMAALEPLVEVILERWGGDLPFLRQVLCLAAERGWAPSLMPVLFRHYTMSADPETSYALLNELAASYASKTPRINDDTPGAEERRAASVQAQVQKWRNGHLRTVLGCGYVDEGRMIYQAGEKAGVGWDVATKNALIHALQIDTSAALPVKEGEPVLSPKRQVLRLAHRRSRQPVRHLVEALTTLEAHGRTRLISRLSTRFLGRRVGGTFIRGSTNETTAAYWWMGHIVKARNEGRHADALELFRERFYAVGLPSIAVRRAQHREPSAGEGKRLVRDRKLYPSAEIITAVLPSVIHLAKPTTPDALVALHAEFMRSASMFPTLKTDPVFHIAFINCYASTFGAAAAERWCERLERSGVDVGVQGWSVVAVEYAKARKMKDIQGILDRMSSPGESQLSPPSSSSAPAMAQPNERTFIGIASALLKRKKHYKAKAILERWHEEQERRGMVVPQEG